MDGSAVRAVLRLVVPMLLVAVGALDGRLWATESTFRVEATRLDLGDIRAGTEAVATFIFHNDGQEAVKILRAKPS